MNRQLKAVLIPEIMKMEKIARKLDKARKRRRLKKCANLYQNVARPVPELETGDLPKQTQILGQGTLREQWRTFKTPIQEFWQKGYPGFRAALKAQTGQEGLAKGLLEFLKKTRKVWGLGVGVPMLGYLGYRLLRGGQRNIRNTSVNIM